MVNLFVNGKHYSDCYWGCLASDGVNEDMSEDIVELDRYEPDWTTKCDNCGQYPTVTGVKDGVVVLETNLCGPCTWGEAITVDPEVWNDPI